MSPEGRRFFDALADSTAMRIAGDKEGAACLRSAAERDYLNYLDRKREAEREVQLELAL